jgi:hypothetical protein
MAHVCEESGLAVISDMEEKSTRSAQDRSDP